MGDAKDAEKGALLARGGDWKGIELLHPGRRNEHLSGVTHVTLVKSFWKGTDRKPSGTNSSVK